MNSIIFGSCTPAERERLHEVVSRAQREVFAPAGIKRDFLDIAMDLEAAHSRTPLDFEKLFEFDSASFAHDLHGIYRHLDRETGALRDCFFPRCALRFSGRFYSSRPEQVGGPWDQVGRVYVINGESVRVLNPRTDLRNHSPTGFAWGYGGSGPAQLALAILADALEDDAVAIALHQRYKEVRIAPLERGHWRITAEEVIRWADEQRVEIVEPLSGDLEVHLALKGSGLL